MSDGLIVVTIIIVIILLVEIVSCLASLGSFAVQPKVGEKRRLCQSPSSIN